MISLSNVIYAMCLYYIASKKLLTVSKYNDGVKIETISTEGERASINTLKTRDEAKHCQGPNPLMTRKFMKVR